MRGCDTRLRRARVGRAQERNTARTRTYEANDADLECYVNEKLL